MSRLMVPGDEGLCSLVLGEQGHQLHSNDEFRVSNGPLALDSRRLQSASF